MKKLSSLLFGTLVVGVSCLTSPTASYADILCQKSGKTIQRFVGPTCPRKWKFIINTDSFSGPAGANGNAGAAGADGADGSLRIYGDGSEGALTVSTSMTLSTPLAQYTDITINSGVTLSVESGTTLRCNGTFTNNGIIFVYTGAEGAVSESSQAPPSALSLRAFRPAAIGIAASPPQEGEYGSNANNLYGGTGGRAAAVYSLQALVNPGSLGGSGGGSSKGNGQGPGGSGGGAIRILCRNAIVNTGSSIISAAGGTSGNGGGGGGGGVIILASPGTITNSGTLNVQGGDGGNSSIEVGSGGGGGGGVIHLISPVVNSAGTIVITGGSPGLDTTPVTNTLRSGGGGGGASGGNGGIGSDVSSTNTVTGGVAGSDGRNFTTLADPTGLF